MTTYDLDRTVHANCYKEIEKHIKNFGIRESEFKKTNTIQTKLTDNKHANISQKLADKVIVDFIIDTVQPLSLVDNPSFTMMIKTLSPGTTVLCRQTLMNKIADNFKVMKDALIVELSDISYVKSYIRNTVFNISTVTIFLFVLNVADTQYVKEMLKCRIEKGKMAGPARCCPGKRLNNCDNFTCCSTYLDCDHSCSKNKGVCVSKSCCHGDISKISSCGSEMDTVCCLSDIKCDKDLFPNIFDMTTSLYDTKDKRRKKEFDRYQATVFADYARLLKMKDYIMRAAVETGVDEYLLASFISKMSRSGKRLYVRGFGPDDRWGLLQIDTKRHIPNGSPYSYANIKQGAQIMRNMRELINRKFPSWNSEKLMKATIGMYKLGDIKKLTSYSIFESMIMKSFIEDIIKRAQIFKKLKIFTTTNTRDSVDISASEIKAESKTLYKKPTIYKSDLRDMDSTDSFSLKPIYDLIFVLKTTGASSSTVEKFNLDVKGIAASQYLINLDLKALIPLASKIKSVARITSIPGELIAALISQRSRVGALLNESYYGEIGFGLYQLGYVPKHPMASPFSYFHIQNGAIAFHNYLIMLKQSYPIFTFKQYLIGALVSFELQTFSVPSLDEIKDLYVNGNLAMDVIARAQWLRYIGYPNNFLYINSNNSNLTGNEVVMVKSENIASINQITTTQISTLKIYDTTGTNEFIELSENTPIDTEPLTFADVVTYSEIIDSEVDNFITVPKEDLTSIGYQSAILINDSFEEIIYPDVSAYISIPTFPSIFDFSPKNQILIDYDLINFTSLFETNLDTDATAKTPNLLNKILTGNEQILTETDIDSERVSANILAINSIDLVTTNYNNILYITNKITDSTYIQDHKFDTQAIADIVITDSPILVNNVDLVDKTHAITNNIEVQTHEIFQNIQTFIPTIYEKQTKNHSSFQHNLEFHQINDIVAHYIPDVTTIDTFEFPSVSFPSITLINKSIIINSENKNTKGQIIYNITDTISNMFVNISSLIYDNKIIITNESLNLVISFRTTNDSSTYNILDLDAINKLLMSTNLFDKNDCDCNKIMNIHLSLYIRNSLNDNIISNIKLKGLSNNSEVIIISNATLNTVEITANTINKTIIQTIFSAHNGTLIIIDNTTGNIMLSTNLINSVIANTNKSIIDIIAPIVSTDSPIILNNTNQKTEFSINNSINPTLDTIIDSHIGILTLEAINIDFTPNITITTNGTYGTGSATFNGTIINKYVITETSDTSLNGSHIIKNHVTDSNMVMLTDTTVNATDMSLSITDMMLLSSINFINITKDVSETFYIHKNDTITSNLGINGAAISPDIMTASPINSIDNIMTGFINITSSNLNKSMNKTMG
ncbi:uncharacterized protein LOC135928727 [Gordionus sp. m RMFG-2023]|uniref:uncharacterized protein LOC135928727 n=1 Tax=Gordionus sp. m RMFG-2023 TaxID=3053472 RepID=UPI0031FE019C